MYFMYSNDMRNTVSKVALSVVLLHMFVCKYSNMAAPTRAKYCGHSLPGAGPVDSLLCKNEPPLSLSSSESEHIFDFLPLLNTQNIENF